MTPLLVEADEGDGGVVVEADVAVVRGLEGLARLEQLLRCCCEPPRGTTLSSLVGSAACCGVGAGPRRQPAPPRACAAPVGAGGRWPCRAAAGREFRGVRSLTSCTASPGRSSPGRSRPGLVAPPLPVPRPCPSRRASRQQDQRRAVRLGPLGGTRLALISRRAGPIRGNSCSTRNPRTASSDQHVLQQLAERGRVEVTRRAGRPVLALGSSPRDVERARGTRG